MNFPRNATELIETKTEELKTSLDKLAEVDLRSFVETLVASQTLRGNVEAYKKLIEVLPASTTPLDIVNDIEESVITEEIRSRSPEIRVFIFTKNQPLMKKIIIEAGLKLGYSSPTVALIKAFEEARSPSEADMLLKYLCKEIDPWTQNRENLFFSTVLTGNFEYVHFVIKDYQSRGINIREYLKKFEWEAFNWSTLAIFKYLLTFLEDIEQTIITNKYQHRIIIQGVNSIHSSFVEIIKILMSRGIVISSSLRDAQNHDGMTPLDMACLDGKIDHVKTILEHLTPEDLKIVLTRPNHGLRVTLDHCTYYEENANSGCRELIIEAMKRVGLGKAVSEAYTLRVIDL